MFENRSTNRKLSLLVLALSVANATSVLPTLFPQQETVLGLAQALVLYLIWKNKI